MCNFLNVKRTVFCIEEISRNLILIKRYQGNRDRGSQEKRETSASERKKERRRKKERVCV